MAKDERLGGRVRQMELELARQGRAARLVRRDLRAAGEEIVMLRDRTDEAEDRLDVVESELEGLRQQMPDIIADAVREALQGRKK
jgi:hypothetical protein